VQSRRDARPKRTIAEPGAIPGASTKFPARRRREGVVVMSRYIPCPWTIRAAATPALGGAGEAVLALSLVEGVSLCDVPSRSERRTKHCSKPCG
jgi:hypothetical protein